LDATDPECTGLALRLLASTAQRGREAVAEGLAVAEAAATTASEVIAVALHIRGGCGGARTRRSGSHRPQGSRSQGESKTADCGTPPHSPWKDGGTGRDAVPRPPRAAASPKHSCPDGGSDSRPTSGEAQRRGRSGSTCQTPRGGSVGARARTDALVQRRLKLFEELTRLNSEVGSLQGEMLSTLARCPPLLPAGSGAQRRRVFNVIGEFLVEAATDLKHASGSCHVTAVLHELLPWLPREGVANDCALLDVRAGILRVGALLDIEALSSLLSEQFLPWLLKARPAAEEESLRKVIAQTQETLRAWVAGQR